MGFKSVYRMLMDVFPQVDNRILRAVAIENAKDADKAAEVVLTEILPNIASSSGSANNSLDSNASHVDDTVRYNSENLDESLGLSKVSSPNNGNDDKECRSNEEQIIFPNVNGHIPSTMGLSANLNCENVVSNHSIVECNQSSSSVSSLDLNTAPEKLSNISGHDESMLDKSAVLNCKDVPSNLQSLLDSHLQQLTYNGNSLDSNTCATNYITFTEINDFENEPKDEKSTLEVVSFENKPMEEEAKSALEVVAHEGTDEKFTLEHEAMEEKSVHQLVEHELIDAKSSQVPSELEGMENISTVEVVELGDEHALKTEVSRSGNVCKMDLLEDIIKEARDNKKTLFTAMESVLSLMREVEVREKEAEQVKEAAARGPIDILANVEDLKKMLQHAREANDMHAGEVYGEKAILATEAKELQSRLLCLSDERDNSLAILDDMRRTLQQRLDAAEKEMKEVEQQKMEKEECARNALAEQQLLMDRLVEESKVLKQEAEENSKLEEFLMDRGRVVDMLQGEISVICQDVKLLKQKFDLRVPLCESLSSSQTSCRLASSSSSLKGLTLDQDAVQIETALETAKRTSPTPSVSDHLSSGEVEANDGDAQVDDEGWEFFDSKELNTCMV